MDAHKILNLLGLTGFETSRFPQELCVEEGDDALNYRSGPDAQYLCLVWHKRQNRAYFQVLKPFTSLDYEDETRTLFAWENQANDAWVDHVENGVYGDDAVVVAWTPNSGSWDLTLSGLTGFEVVHFPQELCVVPCQVQHSEGVLDSVDPYLCVTQGSGFAEVKVLWPYTYPLENGSVQFGWTDQRNLTRHVNNSWEDAYDAVVAWQRVEGDTTTDLLSLLND